jgi:hopanoid-associated phosphorylase
MTGTWPGASEPLGIVTGLATEAGLARRLGRALAGGGTPAGAETAARQLALQGVAGLISFGFAGGLDPALRAGDLVIPATVRSNGRDYPTTPTRWGAPHGTLLAGEDPAATIAEKRRLFATTGAIAIDLESGAVARVATEYGLPFAVLRAISDPATCPIPPAALTALNPDGTIALLAVLASLARHPGQLPALLTLARHTAAARHTLARLK